MRAVKGRPAGKSRDLAPRHNRDRFPAEQQDGVDFVGRRGIKEFRAPEALQLILADRDREPLVCPSCGNSGIERSPKRRLPKARALSHRQVTLRCGKCGRQAVYIPQNVTQPSERELIGS